jgi:hypothetical protein
MRGTRRARGRLGSGFVSPLGHERSPHGPAPPDHRLAPAAGWRLRSGPYAGAKLRRRPRIGAQSADWAAEAGHVSGPRHKWWTGRQSLLSGRPRFESWRGHVDQHFRGCVVVAWSRRGLPAGLLAHSPRPRRQRQSPRADSVLRCGRLGTGWRQMRRSVRSNGHRADVVLPRRSVSIVVARSDRYG